MCIECYKFLKNPIKQLQLFGFQDAKNKKNPKVWQKKNDFLTKVRGVYLSLLISVIQGGQKFELDPISPPRDSKTVKKS